MDFLSVVDVIWGNSIVSPRYIVFWSLSFSAAHGKGLSITEFRRIQEFACVINNLFPMATKNMFRTETKQTDRGKPSKSISDVLLLSCILFDSRLPDLFPVFCSFGDLWNNLTDLFFTQLHFKPQF